MTRSRFYPLPRGYTLSSGDPRGALPADPPSSTIMRYNTWFQHGSGAFASGDPVRYTGRPYITEVVVQNDATGITDGTLLEVVDGYGGVDTFEFRGDGGPAAAGNILVAYGPADLAAAVRDAFLSAANNDPLAATQTTAATQGAASVKFTQNTNYFGGRTGFLGNFGAGHGLVRSQSVPQEFLIVSLQSGYDPVLVVPAILGGQPKWLGTLSGPIYLVT